MLRKLSFCEYIDFLKELLPSWLVSLRNCMNYNIFLKKSLKNNQQINLIYLTIFFVVIKSNKKTFQFHILWQINNIAPVDLCIHSFILFFIRKKSNSFFRVFGFSPFKVLSNVSTKKKFEKKRKKKIYCGFNLRAVNVHVVYICRYIYVLSKKKEKFRPR